MSITPVTSTVSDITGIPMATPRLDEKSRGNRDEILGLCRADQVGVVIDDVITTSKSKEEAMAPFLERGVTIWGVIVVVDRGQGGKQALASKGYEFRSVMTIDECLESCRDAGKITSARFDQVMAYLNERREMVGGC